jgi:C1A family cysteine protease
MNRLIGATIIAGVSASNLRDRASYEAKFYDWIQEHKVAVKDGSDFAHMLENFANNDDFIEKHNAQNLSYTLGHNQFSHMSHEEWVSYNRFGLTRGAHAVAPNVHDAPTDLSTLATSIDWTTMNAVSTVKNQGSCGSCWAFSATGALEGSYCLATGKSCSGWTGLSAQELVSCDKGVLTNHGCNGGLMDYAFEWVEGNNGIASWDNYGYTSGNGAEPACQSGHPNVANTDVSTYTDVTKKSDSALASAINIKPVAVAIQANQPAFQFYKSGVMTGECGDNLDHGVLAVGYGTDNGLDYFKIKNSWDVTWGEQGYIRIQRVASENNGNGKCGIYAGPPSYPTTV